MLVQRARDSLAAVAFCNLVGGQDELVFDGHSVVVDHDGTVIARAHQFREELLVATIDPEGSRAARLRDTRHRPAARRMQAEVDHLAELPRPSVPSDDDARLRADRPAPAPPTPRSTRRSKLGLARLRGQERVPPRRARALGRDRLGARGLPGRRRPRAPSG